MAGRTMVQMGGNVWFISVVSNMAAGYGWPIVDLMLLANSMNLVTVDE